MLLFMIMRREGPPQPERRIVDAALLLRRTRANAAVVITAPALDASSESPSDVNDSRDTPLSIPLAMHAADDAEDDVDADDCCLSVLSSFFFSLASLTSSSLSRFF